ncbi:V-type ATP synthase subunit F [Aminivibrio sp.]|jgi:V/A-type H+-transporting ATPase subunit F|uniref:V-type ATP synthase subunit F n=1 Tax=Aminivibrio sp. TaxID=1872489 RepID=UPI001A4687A1|nr:V-type ATP synthase subunit F [Aminivibrio sp.]MBL3538892.1 V-type ATP synthase subunit F [Aminivibrio sp.]
MSVKNARNSMAAVGEYETVLPFQAVGVRPFIIKDNTPSAVEETLLGLARKKYAVVFVQESCYVASSQFIAGLNNDYETSFIPIPGLKGSQGIGLESIRSSVERAVGMDIFAVK